MDKMTHPHDTEAARAAAWDRHMAYLAERAAQRDYPVIDLTDAVLYCQDPDHQHDSCPTCDKDCCDA